MAGTKDRQTLGIKKGGKAEFTQKDRKILIWKNCIKCPKGVKGAFFPSVETNRRKNRVKYMYMYILPVIINVCQLWGSINSVVQCAENTGKQSLYRWYALGPSRGEA